MEKKEDSPGMSWKENPRNPPEVPSGTTAGRTAKYDLLGERSFKEHSPNESPSAKRTHLVCIQLKAPGSDSDDRDKKRDKAGRDPAISLHIRDLIQDPIVHVSKSKSVRTYPDRPKVELVAEQADRVDSYGVLLPEDSWDRELEEDEYDRQRTSRHRFEAMQSHKCEDEA